MDAGLYRRSGLTITALAAELGYPEHQLRRLINQHLGFRNFSFFLNSFRIEEATERLSDPAEARKPVLTIALDLGYGSLGPFNPPIPNKPRRFRNRLDVAGFGEIRAVLAPNLAPGWPFDTGETRHDQF